MKNYVDMYVQIIDRLLLDVIEHNCNVTPTVLDVWSVLPMCSVNLDFNLMITNNTILLNITADGSVVSITVINSQNNSSTAEYDWNEDEVEDLVYAFANEWPDEYFNESAVQYMKSELQNQTTALSEAIVKIIDRFDADEED
jgi:hypothetical protein